MGILDSGVSVGLLNVARAVILVMLGFFCLWPLVDYNIHYVVMAVLSFCMFLSFEFFVYHLKKNPDIMNPPPTKVD